MSYNIGQVIYIYKDTNESLFPCIVCEEVVKKTLKGQETLYSVLLPDAEGTVVDLVKIDAKVFKSLEEFKTYYTDSAIKKAQASIDNCKKITEQRFKSFLKSVPEKENLIQKEQAESKITISDENNVKLNIDVSKLEELGIWMKESI